jgi:predicted nucleic acid-binding protein
MTLVIDASVLVKLVCEEAGSAQARAVFIAEPVLVAPQLAFLEVFSALWKKMRLGHYMRDQIGPAMSFVEDGLSDVVPDAVLFARASQISLDLGHPIYDCMYLALAERSVAPLATADVALSQAAARMGSVKARLITV